MFSKKPLMASFKTAAMLTAVVIVPLSLSSAYEEYEDITMLNNMAVSGFIALLAVRRYNRTEQEIKRHNPFRPE